MNHHTLKHINSANGSQNSKDRSALISPITPVSRLFAYYTVSELVYDSYGNPITF